MKFESNLDNYIEKYINKTISVAQISIAKNDIIIFSEGYGLTNCEKNINTDEKVSFNYVSLNKLFLWVSAIQLVEQNKFYLNKNIKEYLPKDYLLYIKPQNQVT